VRGEVYIVFWLGDLRETDQLEDPGLDERIISMWIFKKWDGEAWARLIWLRIWDRWRALVNAVMNLRVP
jgi:hypothetical protein